MTTTIKRYDPFISQDWPGMLASDDGDYVLYSDVTALLSSKDEEIARLKEDLEREGIRLAACGVVAMADTPESAVKAREMNDEYRSASCDDVARRVDECMRLRAELSRLQADAERYASETKEAYCIYVKRCPEHGLKPMDFDAYKAKHDALVDGAMIQQQGEGNG